MHREKVTRRSFLGSAAAMTGTAALAGIAYSAADSQSEAQRIEAALPAGVFARPRRPRRLLIFDRNVGYGGHRSIPTANRAFARMGEKTGAYDTTVSRDPAVFAPESLGRFDAVFLNNTVGNLFEDPALRRSLVEFVYSGGGLMGVHGTTVAFTRWPGAHEDWPEFGIMLGARGANHRINDEHVYIKLDDPDHPVNRPFDGKGFDYRDEFFRVHEPYSRDRVRVLMSIDTEKTDMQQGQAYGQVERADNDYALAWVRQYGAGRVFYCTIAHHPAVFWDPKMLAFYLAATQFALGDLIAPTTPSAKLTPAVEAQETLDWKLALVPSTPEDETLFETIDKAAELGLLYVGGHNRQKVSRNMPKHLGPRLDSNERKQIRLKLDAAHVRLLTYRVDGPASEETQAFARTMGVETCLTAAGSTGTHVESLDEAHRRNDLAPLLHRAHRRGKPTIFAMASSNSMSELAQRIDSFNNAALRLLGENGREHASPLRDSDRRFSSRSARHS